MAYPAPIQAIISGPYWPQWPEKYEMGIASRIHPPTPQGGTVEGMNLVGPNLAKMVKWMENRSRERARTSAAELEALGLQVSIDGQGNRHLTAVQ